MKRTLILTASLAVLGAGCIDIPYVPTFHRDEGCTPDGCLPDEDPPTVDPNEGRIYPPVTPGPVFDDPNSPDPNAPQDWVPPVRGPVTDANEPPQVGTGDPPVPPALAHPPDAGRVAAERCDWVPSCWDRSGGEP